jgi:hypothetical protein
MPFPPLSWWIKTLPAKTLILDKAEHFEKMSYRNKYYITGSSGMICLSIPLQKGREQRNPVGTIRISNAERWQVQHWRTLVSVYKRSPYFDHYEPSLRQLFEREFDLLADFNLASITWLRQQLKADFLIETTDTYQKEFNEATDLRNMKRSKEKGLNYPEYYQLFEERNGFLPNLSLLDLLFSEGPQTAVLLKEWNN